VLQPPGPGPSPRAGSHVQEGGAGGGTAKEERGNLERGNLEGIGQLNQFPTAYSRHDSFLAMQVRCAVAIVTAVVTAVVTATPRYSFACHSFAVNEKISS